jgi:hypothetical protein
VFGLPIGGKEINNHHKNIMWAPLDIHISKVYVVVKHLANVGHTYSVLVVFTNARRTSSMKTFFDGKLTFKHNQRVNICNQIDSKLSSKAKNPWSQITLHFAKASFGYHGPLKMGLKK